jgi:hypothetical protein
MRNAANKLIEDATEFSSTKFATTIRAIAATAVPATHTLAFHYTTIKVHPHPLLPPRHHHSPPSTLPDHVLQGARRAMRSGILTQRLGASEGGVLVSLRGPHQLTNADLRAFGAKGGGGKKSAAFEAVLALRVPARLLRPVSQSMGKDFDVIGATSTSAISWANDQT